MASYQDIDVRLVGVENALKFLMDTMRVKVQIGSPLATAPLVREMSIYDFYKMQLAQGILEPVKDDNGTDSTSVADAAPVE